MELEKSAEFAAVSAITLGEVARMVVGGIFETAVPVEEYLGSIETNPSLIILPLTARIAAESVRLGNTFTKDPADQIIVATARCHSLTLMTADERIRRWGKVPIL
jgi:PIN domain nuclease of toxin-antitoxin system